MARSDACRLKNTFNVEKMWDVHLFKRVCEEFTSLRGSDPLWAGRPEPTHSLASGRYQLSSTLLFELETLPEMLTLRNASDMPDLPSSCSPVDD